MNTIDKKVVTRFAPSPTGLLHLGTYRTAIFAYLYALQNKGKFILRIEDTDKQRSKKEYEDNILDSLRWLDIKYDEMYRQSDLLDRHQFYLNKLIDEGKAYVSKEEAKDGSKTMKEVVRFKNPNISVTWNDLIKGPVTFDTTDLKDFVIAKSLVEPLFHLAVVVDDFEESVTHVIRGEDHTSNTPRQILIQRAIGAPEPIYAHLPLVLAPDKLKLSKRRGALPVTEYRERGYLKEAVLNGIVFVGWNPGTDKEIFSFSELVSDFSLDKVQKSPAVFNEEKFLWFNKEHLKLMNDEFILKQMKMVLPEDIKQSDFFEKLVPVIRERISVLSDIKNMYTEGELDFFISKPEIQKDELLCPIKLRKGVDVSAQEIAGHLKRIITILEALDETDWACEKIKDALWDYATEQGRGVVLWAMRYALSGREKSPDPFSIAYILGKEETISRIKYAAHI